MTTLPLEGFEGVVIGHDGERRAHDYYATPRWAVEAVLPVLRARVPVDCHIIEPAVGHGAIASVLAAETWDPLGAPLPRWAVRGLDIDPVRVAEAQAAGIEATALDFLAASDDELRRLTKGRRAAFVANPPYVLAMEFVERAIAFAGKLPVAMLLRLSFLSSQKRAAFWRAHPADVMVLDRRPSFTGGGTDSSDYGWFIWPGSVTVSGRGGTLHRGIIAREGDAWVA